MINKCDIKCKIKLGFKLWLLTLLAGLILFIPSIIINLLALTKYWWIILILFIPLALLNFYVLGSLLNKYSGWLYR